MSTPTTNEPRKPKIGDTIASYTIRSKLGSGGMGDVYLCDDAALGRRVAVKIMHAFDTSDTDAKDRFILEGKALARLTHPNIVSVFGLGEDKGFLYIAMEHVAGRSLYQLSRERKLTIREMISIFGDIAQGLDHAHSLGIIHRDIKPANILVDTFGKAKIIDFGIAKSIGGNPMGAEGVKTKTGAVIGTLNYIAPELFRGDPPSPSSDIYALGLLFFEMLTGRTPFKGESQFATMEMIRKNELDIPENLKVLLPEETWEVLNEMIDHEPLRRPRSCVEAAQKLKAIQFPNMPNYFSSELISVSIANVGEVQDILDKEGIDPAEWQFVMSLAIRRQAELGKEAPSSEEESTRLIESTALKLSPEVVKAAIDDYRRDLNTMLTVRRSEQLSSLTPPIPVAEVTPHTNGVDVKPVVQMPRPGAMPPPTAAHQVEEGGSGKWIAAVALIACLGGGYVYMQNQKAKEAEAAAQAKAQESTRKRVAVDAPPASAMSGGGSGGAGFAMVVEPPTDAWPPIQLNPLEVGPVRTYKWKVEDGRGEEFAFVERRTWEAVEDGLVKVKVERLKKEGNAIVSTPAGWEWFQDGFYALPRKTLQSPLFGSVGGAAVGTPGAIFPLRKGKEVQFELSFKATEAVAFSPVVNLATQAASVSYRSSCSIGDKMKLTAAIGSYEVVKVNCSMKADTLEVSDTLYWSVDLNAAIRQERRVSSTAGGVISEITMKGELADSSVPGRTPAHK